MVRTYNLIHKTGKFFVNKFIPVFDFLSKDISTSTTVMKSEVEKRFTLPNRYHGNEKNIWVEYIKLAAEHKPINLGQGFPDFAAPEHVRNALAEAVLGPNPLLNQYTRSSGHPRLVTALAKMYSTLIGRQIDPLTEVIITNGAYEALYAMLAGHLHPGDEVIVIEPFFDCYEPMSRICGAVVRFIPLKPAKTTGRVASGDWVFDRDELSQTFNEKTKIIIINTPNNPLGKVFTMDELEFIADLCKKWNVLCVADEVYEWMVYEPNVHIRMASLPGMWERTVTVGSAGKSFSVTGWKIGWAYGPAHLICNAQVVHQNSVYTCSTPLQEALAVGFEEEYSRLFTPDCYFMSLVRDLTPKRDMIVNVLREVGMVPIEPQGGYFVLADWTPLESKIDLSQESDLFKDYRFTKWMTKNIGLQGIPPSAFYSEEHKHLGENYVRYCFIKEDKNLEKAGDVLRKWKAQL